MTTKTAISTGHEAPSESAAKSDARNDAAGKDQVVETELGQHDADEGGVDEAAEREAREDEARLLQSAGAALFKQNREIREEAEDHDAFDEDRREADDGPRIAEDDAIAVNEMAAVER